MTPFTKVIGFLCCLALLCLCAALWKGQVDVLKIQNEQLQLERDQALATATAWEKTATLCARNVTLLQVTSRACLDREQEGAATADLWQDILEKAQSRDSTDKEKLGVPDDTTRRKLCLDLDRPL